MSALRLVAPAGAPIGAADLVGWTVRLIADRDPRGSLCAAIRELVGVPHASVVSTGRAGMTLILRAMRTLSPSRDEVIVPSYTCFSVAAAVVKAGLKPRVVDIATETLDYHYGTLERVDAQRVLAIIATNLYGMPNDLPRLTRFARERGAFLIDDAAQALGARVGGRWAGTWGDAGLYSFDKGKNVSAINGGVIVTASNDLHAAIDREVASLPQPGWRHSVENVVKLTAYSLLLRPSLYWIPNRIPQLGLGKTPFDTSYPVESNGRLLQALAVTMLRRLEQFNRSRRATASQLIERLKGVPGVSTLVPTVGSDPVYVRFPLLASDTSCRARLLTALNASGIGATASYPTSIADIPALRPLLARGTETCDNGRLVASRIVTLPTHPYVRPADVDVMISTLRTSTEYGRAPSVLDAVAR